MRFNRLRSLSTLTLLAGFLCATLNLAQAQSRITAAIDENSLHTLSGNVSPLAIADYDRGEAAPSTQMTHMRLVLSRSAQKEAQLEALIASQQDPSSANYHKWLTPAQFSANYGVSTADLKTLVTWLQGRGFTVERVDSGGMSIAFSGTVDLVESAFHTQIHSFNANGEAFLANTTDPKIPSALAGVVAGITRLNTTKPKPMSVRSSNAQFDPVSKKLKAVGSEASPELTSNGVLFLVAQDAATIYNSPNSTLNTSYSGTKYDGTGIHIGVGGESLVQASTVWNYRNRFLGQTIPTSTTTTTEACGTNPALEVSCSSVAVSHTGLFSIYNVDNVTLTTNSGAQDEAYIDVELTGALAPGANIDYYTSQDLNSAIEQMLSDNTVNIFSLSFGQCELGLGSSGNLQVKGWWQQAATQGISVFVSTGDSGAAGCDDPNTQTTSYYGLQVNGLASTVYNVAVGGTDFYPLASTSTFSTYVGTTNGTYYGTAKSFIPESTWNDSTTVNETYSLNVNNRNITGGSGGASNCINGNGSTTNSCTIGYAKPTWQAGTGVPSDGVRDIPDVSLFASNGEYNAVWLICTDDAVSGGGTDNCATASGGGFNAIGYGGTSTAAPATAGIFALVAQKAGALGVPNAELYALASSSNGSSIFHDTVVGNISVPCNTSQTPTGECLSATSGFFLDGYNTTTGYDLATGLGSVNIAELVSNWGSVTTGTNTATVSVNPASSTLNSGSSLVVTGSVTGTAGTATGSVTLTVTSTRTGTSYSTSQTLSTGAYSITIPANTFAGGTTSAKSDTISVSYSGDSNYLAASNSANVAVTSTTYTMSISSSTSVTAGSSSSATVTLTPYGSYAGTVTVSCSLTSEPTNAKNVPTCSGGSATFTSSSTTASTVTVNIGTTANAIRGGALKASNGNWKGTVGTLALAVLLFFGIPARSRRFRAMLGALIVLIAIGTVSGCGSGGGSNGTTAGSYTFTITATGSDSLATTQTSTITLTVN